MWTCPTKGLWVLAIRTPERGPPSRDLVSGLRLCRRISTHLLIFSTHHWNSCKESAWSWCSSLCVTSGQPAANKTETHRGSQRGLWWLYSFPESLFLPSLVWKEWGEWWGQRDSLWGRLLCVSITFSLMPPAGREVCKLAGRTLLRWRKGCRSISG